MYRILCGGLILSFAVGAGPAMAVDPDSLLSADDVGVGAGWIENRTRPASRSAEMRPIGVTRSQAKAVAFLVELADARTGGYWGSVWTGR